jgi:hypothetical protein
MDLLALFLADHAEAVNGKLYVTGGFWDRIFAANFPTKHPHMTACVVVSVPWTETNQEHSLMLALLDADGNEMGPKIEGRFEVGRPPGARAGDASLFQLAVHLTNMTFPRAGEYSFAVQLDDEPKLPRATFKVVKATVQGLPT